MIKNYRIFILIAFLLSPRPLYAASIHCAGGNSINTAIGCIPTDPAAFVSSFTNLSIGIAGGIALLLTILGGFQVLMSVGNPEKINAGRELIASAFSGLLLIVLSLFILRMMGVQILSIPGFK